ncbi:MAG: histidine phosphatase family protein [Bacteroidales bacterium]
MRRELFILRHAKSSWSEVDKSDKDRALKPKGIKDIALVAKSVQNVIGNLELIISSPANRAIHTSILFSESIGFPLNKISINKKLYEADESMLMDVIANQNPEIQSLMIVGHNPTLSYFVNSILPEPIFELPTSGLVCLYFDTENWADISKASLVEFNTSFIIA